ncbi:MULTISPECIES: biotin--[acetyl-CoA-carboxylase] ligase [Halorubrum]|uniref:BirA family transcriptional regulator, biotin operon repressor / biotin-[acetyl-CoA-carboxylase] ligase n=1 Tax=Halorubrum sodomense TaxID=35743 RepID=A0A1I6HCA5_HALSD|nr:MULTISPECIES: biotin--[acetyl-CoA-carboxylase] ligase [Halorubrum]TKX55869.1 biotin--[acetyl-CoA-carboxylase] ligase [Halorubrum sp. SP3]TKX71347.1 biotin--[acetyl-CoA-carboxylase] ligase [Halorubrum sp. SP9]SFR51917.1 BirA family transcriptional regulator, biotin operon repressor / biotin-[acetyl-CoA-carboxylase] ligase [Halorubrum sodomense]
MDTRRALLDALAADDGPVSGPALADSLGVSRAAVWKAVEGLREEGFAIGSTPDGYVPPDDPGYSGPGIAFGLDAPYSVEYRDRIASTNERARELAGAGAADVAVVADEQTGGRGRLDREWVAPSGGVWLSVLTRPDVPTARAPLFTLAAAVATTDAAREAGVDAHIKWPNDVLVGGEEDAEGDVGEGHDGADPEATGRGGRKLAGILTEMEGEADRVGWLVVGVGVNANIVPETLPAGAASLSAERGEPIDRRRFAATLLERYAALTASPAALDGVLPAWRERASTLGRRVRVEAADGVVEGTAVDVAGPGALVVDTDEGRRRVHAGDCEHLRDAE